MRDPLFGGAKVQPGRLSRISLASLISVTAPWAAQAAELYQFNVTVQNPPPTPQTASYTFNNLNQALNAFQTRGAVPTVFSNTSGYTNASGATAVGTLRGIPVTASFAQASNTLTFSAPSIGVTQTFNGDTRTDSARLLADFLRASRPGLINRALPRTLIDPVIGNPIGLANRMVGRDFQSATGIGGFEPSFSPNERGPGGGLARIPNALTVGGEFSYGAAAGTDVFSTTVPIDYKVFFDDPRYSLNFDLPISYVEIGGAKIGQASFGTSFKFPILENWSLAAAARTGITGSQDLLEGDLAYSGSIASIYNIYFDDYKVTIGNSVGVVKTSPVKIGRLVTGPSTTNVPLVNGVSLEGSLPFTVLDKPASYEAYVVDTYFAGDRLGIQHYDEIGANFGTRRVLGTQSWDNARIGVAYTFGKSFNLGSLRLSYRF